MNNHHLLCNSLRLTFLAILRETLRLQPPATARGVSSPVDTTIGGGKYAVKAGVTIAIQNWVAMKDPALWGEDAEEFNPDRMMDGKFEALPVGHPQCFFME